MTLPHPSTDRALRIYLTLAQYPIIRTRIRARMRRELFDRGVILLKDFEAEVRKQAVRSQAREGFQERRANHHQFIEMRWKVAPTSCPPGTWDF